MVSWKHKHGTKSSFGPTIAKRDSILVTWLEPLPSHARFPRFLAVMHFACLAGGSALRRSVRIG